MIPPPNFRHPDEIVFRSDLVTVGKFRCPIGHPMFRDSGPIRQSCIVFPRSSVVIEHEGQRPFVGDAALATLYNSGQVYERRAVSSEGDRCDWFAFSSDLLCDVVRPLDPAAADDPPRAMRYTHGPVSSSLYLEQRQLFQALQSDEPTDALEVEERAISLLGRVLSVAYGPRIAARPQAGRRALARRADIGHAAREVIARNFSRRQTLTNLSRQVGCSPFHLCRSFQQVTGSTLHAHVTTLRLRAALERVDRTSDLTTVALEAGFSSHSHFSAAFRRAFGVPPSRVFRAIS